MQHDPNGNSDNQIMSIHIKQGPGHDGPVPVAFFLSGSDM